MGSRGRTELVLLLTLQLVSAVQRQHSALVSLATIHDSSSIQDHQSADSARAAHRLEGSAHGQERHREQHRATSVFITESGIVQQFGMQAQVQPAQPATVVPTGSAAAPYPAAAAAPVAGAGTAAPVAVAATAAPVAVAATAAPVAVAATAAPVAVAATAAPVAVAATVVPVTVVPVTAPPVAAAAVAPANVAPAAGNGNITGSSDVADVAPTADNAIATRAIFVGKLFVVLMLFVMIGRAIVLCFTARSNRQQPVGRMAFLSASVVLPPSSSKSYRAQLESAVTTESERQLSDAASGGAASGTSTRSKA